MDPRKKVYFAGVAGSYLSCHKGHLQQKRIKADTQREPGQIERGWRLREHSEDNI